ncbi:ORF60-3 [Ostreid herpesvirus 1]|nr:ORF60-3 [Ostreid herpesvirus 1]
MSTHNCTLTPPANLWIAMFYSNLYNFILFFFIFIYHVFPDLSQNILIKCVHTCVPMYFFAEKSMSISVVLIRVPWVHMGSIFTLACVTAPPIISICKWPGESILFGRLY